MNPEQIDRYLDRVAKRIQADATLDSDGVGLLNGKTGVAIFCYLYARYSGDKSYHDLADRLIDRIMDHITPNTPSGYFNGLTGVGVGIEYLAREGYVEADTDEVFEDLDRLIHAKLQISRPFDMLGFGKYLASRITGPHRRTDLLSRNIESAQMVMTAFGRGAYATYLEAIRAIDVLTDFIQAGVEQAQARDYIGYAIDKIETMVYEDIHFENYPGSFNPLGVAVKLSQAYEKNGDKTMLDKASFFLEKYEPGFGKYLDNDSCGLLSGSFKWGTLYRYLGCKLPRNEYTRFSEEWIARSLEKEELFNDKGDDRLPVNALDGYAGIGLSLLGFTGRFPDWNWLNIIPVYFEKERKNLISA